MGMLLHFIQPLKKTRSEAVRAIPSVLPSVNEKADRVSVGQLTSVAELCDNIHKLEVIPCLMHVPSFSYSLYFTAHVHAHSQLPGQMAAVLGSPLLQHMFTMWPDPSAALRLTYWLQHSLGYGKSICTYNFYNNIMSMELSVVSRKQSILVPA